MSHDLNKILHQLTLEEKAGLTSGKDNWFTKSVEHCGVESVRVSDGPHGLRMIAGDEKSISEDVSVPAVCFPAACATGASFNAELIEEMGCALGRECQTLGINVLLGPGINMKRSPLCGRNFEYFSEDPYLAGELGAAFVKGVQNQGVGTSLKHFFANNQEHRREDSSSEMDERTMREIYLPAFERVVKKAQPWTVMTCYNKIRGEFSTANKTYLQNVLRDEWGFEGLVVSDWGATHDRVAAIAAGCDLTMPAAPTDYQIVEAVKDGRLSENDLDRCCLRVLQLVEKAKSSQKNDVIFAYEKDHELARKIAGESMVLLKNNDTILPLDKKANVAFIGEFAKKTRFQGGGSSHVNSFRISNAYDSAREQGICVTYAKGYEPNGMTSDTLLVEAVKTAKEAEVAVVFVGLTDQMESECVDRFHMRLPEGHDLLVEKVCEVQRNTIVVLHNGSPVEMPWIDKTKAILEAYLCGQAAGEATVDILFGDVNPSGHLAETFPKRIEDNPSYLSYFGENGIVRYQEGVFMGYRYYETKKMDVLFPFGHGLSYTTFTYDSLLTDKAEMNEDETLQVRVTVSNTGLREGKVVAQLYVAPERVEVIRPVCELKAFQKVSLQPGESKELCFQLSKRDFAYWNSNLHDWKVESGEFTIKVGNSVRDISVQTTIKINAEPLRPIRGYKLEMPIYELERNEKGKVFLDENIGYFLEDMEAGGFVARRILDEAGFRLGNTVTTEMLEFISREAEGYHKDMPGSKISLLNRSVTSLYNALPIEKKKQLEDLLEEL